MGSGNSIFEPVYLTINGGLDIFIDFIHMGLNIFNLGWGREAPELGSMGETVDMMTNEHLVYHVFSLGSQLDGKE